MICCQISDLHIPKRFSLNKNREYLDLFVEKLKEYSNQDKDIWIICNGDITNKGEEKNYRDAKKIFDYIRRELENDHSVQYVMVPGNHDRCKGAKSQFDSFDSFVSSVMTEPISYKKEAIHVIEVNKYDMSIVLINTAVKSQYYGFIDYKHLDKKLKEAKNPALIVMHHTLMSRFKDDESAIRDAYELIKCINSNDVLGVLHGHTHGYSDVSVGKNCKVVGTGSFFKYFKNCSFQFNIIEIGPESIRKVINCRYQADNSKITEDIVFEDEPKWLFSDTSIFAAYDRVLKAAKYAGPIHNLAISVNMNKDVFFTEVEGEFATEIKRAEKWLASKPSDEYYYNHGSYMWDGKRTGIDYVIENLKKNSTSNRAIISLLPIKEIMNHNGGYLPGLLSVQFGFENDKKDKLLCTMNLRSLEISKFLKINIAEIYILSKIICGEFRSISNVQIVIQAFTAQVMDDFSCFCKAQLDTMNSITMASLYSKETLDLRTLLEEKFNKQETIIELGGLNNLKKVISEFGENKYTGLTKAIDGLINSLERLKEEYGKNSRYDSREIRKLQKEIKVNEGECLKILG